jgi:hypothetical protein
VKITRNYTIVYADHVFLSDKPFPILLSAGGCGTNRIGYLAKITDRVTGWRRHPQAGAAGWCGTNLFEISPKFCPKITGWRLNPHGSVHGEQDRTIDVAGRDPSTPRIHTPSLCLVHPQMTPSIRTYCVSIIAAKNTLLMEKPSNDPLETARRLRLSDSRAMPKMAGKTDASICSNQPASVKRKTPYQQRECRHATSNIITTHNATTSTTGR